MKERPILFSGPMVRAILDGHKTQTRRIVKPQPTGPVDLADYHKNRPYGIPGDRLWVRETFAIEPGMGDIYYRADSNHPEVEDCATWKPSIHMPRKHCRLLLDVTGIRVQRLNDMTFSDAGREGLGFGSTAYRKFQELWDTLNGKRGYGWATNPWVWVIEFAALQQESA